MALNLFLNPIKLSDNEHNWTIFIFVRYNFDFFLTVIAVLSLTVIYKYGKIMMLIQLTTENKSYPLELKHAFSNMAFLVTAEF